MSICDKNLNPLEMETNWFKILTDSGFVIRLVIILLATVYCMVVITGVTMSPNSKSWYYKLHKPDWAPDGVIIAIIFGFFALLLGWVWYRFSYGNLTGYNVSGGLWFEILILVMTVLLILWTVFLYQGQNLTVAKYLICFLLGLSVVLLIGCWWKFGFQDVTLYSFMYVGWLIVILLYTFDLHELDKEYKLLSIVTDKSSSLYHKKMKMEIVEGIKITEDGQKIEFSADEQE